MNIEFNPETREWLFDGITPEKEMEMQAGLDYETAQDAGLLRDEEIEKSVKEGEELQKKRSSNPLTALDNFFGYTSPAIDKEYEQLSIGESWKDAGNAVWNELSHIWQPKSKEVNYEARTRLGETCKYLYRYGAGMIGFGKIGAALKGIGAIGKLGKLGTALSGAGKFINS